MKFHRLAMFWRDQEYRVYTYLNFALKTNSIKASIARAQKIVGLLASLTDLQLYGVALDDLPLEYSLTNITPIADLTVRGTILLNPAADLNPRAGVTRITITIPAPNSQFQALSRDYDHPLWQQLNKEVFPYLCLNTGMVIDKAKPVDQVKITTLSNDQLHQAGEPPVARALRSIQDKLNLAYEKHQQKRTDKTEAAIKREQERYDALKVWADLEVQFYQDALNFTTELDIEDQLERAYEQLAIEEADQLETIDAEPALELDTDEVTQMATEPTTTIEATTTPEPPNQVATPAEPASLGETIAGGGDEPLEVAVEAQSQEPTSAVSEPQPAREAVETQAVVSAPLETGLLLPVRNMLDAEKWQDIPESDWTDPNAWLHRDSIIALYNLSHSKFYRLMKQWDKQGVRCLLANAPGHLGRTRLFYRADVEMLLKGDIDMANKVGSMQADGQAQSQKGVNEQGFGAKLLGGMLGDSNTSPSQSSIEAEAVTTAAATQQQAQLSEFITKQAQQMASLHDVITKQNEQLTLLQQQNALFQELLQAQQGQLKAVADKVAKLEKEKKAKFSQTTIQKQMASQTAAMLEITNRLSQLVVNQPSSLAATVASPDKEVEANPKPNTRKRKRD